LVAIDNKDNKVIDAKAQQQRIRNLQQSMQVRRCTQLVRRL